MPITASKPLSLSFLIIIAGLTACSLGKEQPRDPAKSDKSLHSDKPSGHNRPRLEGRYTMRLYRNANVSYPNITGYPNQRMMDIVNSSLAETATVLKCVVSKINKSDMAVNTFEAKPQVTYHKNNVLSIYLPFKSICNNGIPVNNGNISETYDLSDGAKIVFGDLFKEYAKDKKEIVSLIFAEEISRVKERLGRGSTGSSDSCDDDVTLYATENLMDSDFSYNISDYGIYVQPQWPHVVEACSKRVLVKFSTIARFARTSGILHRINQGQ